MGKRFNDSKNINYLKRKKKQRNKREKYIKREEEIKAVSSLLQYETARALSTLPEPGNSREKPNDENTPKVYFHHVIRKTIEEEVDKVFSPKIKDEDPEITEANITPAASYDFFD